MPNRSGPRPPSGAGSRAGIAAVRRAGGAVTTARRADRADAPAVKAVVTGTPVVASLLARRRAPPAEAAREGVGLANDQEAILRGRMMTSLPSACGPRYQHVAVVGHRPIAERIWRIRIESPALAAAATPGQFVMLRLPGRTDPLLARPLAVYDVFPDPDGRPRYVDFVYTVHGRFTTALAGLPAGEQLVAWGPLGNGFDPPAADHLVLVAGGIGQTALLALARERSGQARYGSPPRQRRGRSGSRSAGAAAPLPCLATSMTFARQAAMCG